MIRKIFLGHIAAASWLIFPVAAHADIVRYELTFKATWSAATHPDSYPSSAHFSSLIGLTHNTDYALWTPGELASVGVENVAETGSTAAAKAEMAAAITAGAGYEQFGIGGLSRVPRAINGGFNANSTHPLVSFISMIAPSPDWFVGGRDVPLKVDGHWRPEIRFDMVNWDAGTEDGDGFSTNNPATTPAVPIHEITTGSLAGTPPLGFFLLELSSTPGDFDGDKQLGVGDIDILCASFGTSNPDIELSGDDVIDGQDLHFLVVELMETQLGDSDLDGNVDFNDFLGLSSNFGQEGTWGSGDFNCSGDVTFADFLFLSRNFSAAAVAAQGVPEPSDLMLLAAPLLFVGHCRRRRT